MTEGENDLLQYMSGNGNMLRVVLQKNNCIAASYCCQCVKVNFGNVMSSVTILITFFI